MRVGEQPAPPLTSMQEGEAFRPPSRYIGECQRIQVPSLDIGATMGHQVRLQKAGPGLVPLRECADGDLLLEQGASSRRGEATLALFALGTQQAIRCRGAHGKQLASAFLGQVEMLMPLQRFDQRREKRDEAFGADAVGGVPDQEQARVGRLARNGVGVGAEGWFAPLSHG